MYTVGVSDHVMVAHSLKGEIFGPAQRLHGATYEVEAEVVARNVDDHGIVLDIGLLRSALRETLTPLEYQNLDELPDFLGKNTTTEFLCRWIHSALASRLSLGADTELRITLHESPDAWAAYEGRPDA